MKEMLCEFARRTAEWLSAHAPELAMRLLYAALIFALGALLIVWLRRVLVLVLKRFGGERAMATRFVVSVCCKAAWACLVVIVLARLGVNVGPVIAGLGVTGFILGFAFQESLGSLASGLMLAFNRPFKLGDFVQIAAYEGTVAMLDMMAVVLETADGHRITVPNKLAWGAPIVNFTARGIRRISFSVGLEYGSDLTRARETAVGLVAALPRVLPDPAPAAAVTSLNDSDVVLTVRLWTKVADYVAVLGAGYQVLHDGLLAAGFTIPYPQLEVSINGGGSTSKI